MKFLIDGSTSRVAKRMQDHPKLVLGQLLTPLTKYKNRGGLFAIDNGAYSGLRRKPFYSLMVRNAENIKRCLFLAVPDVVGSARRTTELYFHLTQREEFYPYTEKWAFVMQDGQEDLPIDWYAIRYVFIGGSDEFKDSSAAYDIVKTAKALDLPVHVGRVNHADRYLKYMELGADTCDGSGIARYDHMLQKLEANLK